jgi:hypothetical protein
MSIGNADPEMMRKRAAANAPALPSYTGGATGGASADRRNIDWLLNPDFDTSEVDTRAAESAVGGGYSGSGFALNNRTRLRDSERIRRMQLGHEMLQPYENRNFQAGESTKAQAAQLQQQVLAGQQAMERLALSERGQTERMSMAEAAAMRRLIEQGRLASEQLSKELQSRATLQGNEFTQQKSMAEIGQMNAKELLELQQKFAAEQQGNQIASSNYQAALNRSTGSSGSSTQMPRWSPAGPSNTSETANVLNSILSRYSPSTGGGAAPQDPWAALQSQFNAENPSGRAGDGYMAFVDPGSSSEFTQQDEWEYFGA